MTYVPDSHRLHGLSIDAATCFGMPHIDAYYDGDSVRSNRLAYFARCAVCGEPATNSHHEPPIGLGSRNASFFFAGNRCNFILRPALIALCGSGTTGCHGLRHSGEIRFRWVWKDDESAEAWWDGDLLETFGPHAGGLFSFGEWQVIRNGDVIKQIRC